MPRNVRSRAGALLALMLMLLDGGRVVLAQYYPPPGYYPPGGGYYRPAPPPGYYPPPGPYRHGPPPGHYYSPRRDPYGFGPGYERRGNLSRICMTGRGPCAMEHYLPIGQGCRCKIDGLRKGGVVQ